MDIQSYRDLRVWREAMELAEGCYRLTGGFPKDELFGMTAQIRRAGVSIPANIAEGYGRGSAGAYVHFLKVAQGSLKELETHLLLAERVGLAEGAAITSLLEACDSVGKMLRSLIRAIERGQNA
ncbi:four helix bundle protein [Chelatococcus caeni]|uniref:Four helix bundle protein n=1 Tax=Chelatococcus caeni TaxID=1348468 RepID=A0A840BRP8_9HYPH|nr:four helix bundle protein [Chelatococcus caeni]MBB4016111.1 four helix bundle protein [Chelatococcus caeni]